VIAGRNLNSLTRGPNGFNNWLAAVVAGVRPAGNRQNCFEFAVRGKMPDHPSPKPIEYMRKLLPLVSDKGDTILDCFAGSGTTGVACVRLDRSCVMVEINETFCRIAADRVDRELDQLKLGLEVA
jgi:site-specific DNA-methyltransferase (adenine-specific)